MQKTQQEEIEVPKEQYLSEQQMQDHINKEINVALDLGNEFVIQEATNTIRQTRNAVTSLLDSNYSEAKYHINKAIARADLITLADNEARVTSEVNVEVIRGVNNVEAAQEIIYKVDSLFQMAEFQKVRYGIAQLANEIKITRESISIPYFLDALKTAEQHIDRRQYDKAMLALNRILSSVVIERSTVPLPLLRAQRMVAEIDKLLKREDLQQNDIKILLDNAEYQIEFAEILGYGKAENEYEALYEEIKKIRKSIEKAEIEKSEIQVKNLNKLLKELRNKIAEYK